MQVIFSNSKSFFSFALSAMIFQITFVGSVFAGASGVLCSPQVNIELQPECQYLVGREELSTSSSASEENTNQILQNSSSVTLAAFKDSDNSDSSQYDSHTQNTGKDSGADSAQVNLLESYQKEHHTTNTQDYSVDQALEVFAELVKEEGENTNIASMKSVSYENSK